MHIREFHKYLISRFSLDSIDARLIIQHTMNITREDFLLKPDTQIDTTAKSTAIEFAERRAEGLPIAYITGRKEFFSRDFIVNPSVLIPRPETEILVEYIIDLLGKRKSPHILDLGTGSGCIIQTLLAEIPDATGVAVDNSLPALEVARLNAAELQVKNRLNLLESNWFSNVVGQFDIIASNPPYIALEEPVGAETTFEPDNALYAPKNALECYEKIANSIGKHMARDGFAVFEIGIGQLAEVRFIFLSAGLEFVGCRTDLAGIERVVAFKNKL